MPNYKFDKAFYISFLGQESNDHVGSNFAGSYYKGVMLLVRKKVKFYNLYNLLIIIAYVN